MAADPLQYGGHGAGGLARIEAGINKSSFAEATGLTPIAYVQRLRGEDAKRRLERTQTPIDEIS